jgi:hypothetical protein
VSLAIYSQSLRALVNECLLLESPGRPSPEALVARTRRGLDSARKASGSMPNQPPLVSKPQPVPSARWFSVDPNSVPNQPKPASYTPAPSELLVKMDALEIERQIQANKLAAKKAEHTRIKVQRAQGGNPLAMNPIVPRQQAQGAIPPGSFTGLGANIMNARAYIQAQTATRAQADMPFNLGLDLLPPRNQPLPPNRPLPQPLVLVPITELKCIIQRIGFLGNLVHSTHTLYNLKASMTFYQIKRRLVDLGVNIPIVKMKMTSGTVEFMDNQLLGELGGNNILRVIER